MQTKNLSTGKNEQGLNVVDLLLYLASKWKWFVLSVLVFGGLAYVWYASSPLVYFRSATVIIKDPSNKTTTAGLDRYDNFINKVNVANEILQFRSKKLMREVVKRVHADVSYRAKDGFRYNELYTRSPVIVSFPDVLPNREVSFTVTPKDKEHVVLSHFNGEEESKPLTVSIHDTIPLAEGHAVVTPTHFYGHSWMGQPIEVRKMALDAVAATNQGALGLRQGGDEAHILKR